MHNAKLLWLSAAMLWTGIQGSAFAGAGDDHGRPEVERAQGARPDARAAPRPSNAIRPAAAANRPMAAADRPAFDGRGQVLDQRYRHGYYYPPVGTVRTSLPPDYRPYYRGNDRFYFNGGVWYAPRGPGFVVVTPPPGLVISVLPPYYSTVWIGGSPYYYADNVYYTWQPDQNGYAVVDPPDNADQPTAPPDSAQAMSGPGSGPGSGSDDLIVYPKNGQSKDQQAADQYECHAWAKNQSGFDPTLPEGGIQAGDVDRSRNNYYRAMSACLQGRGYQVN
jgi:hypothetical protein